MRVILKNEGNKLDNQSINSIMFLTIIWHHYNEHMSKLPKSFDPFLMQDELMATLKQSPLTSQLVPLRAEQILELIIQKPICMMLQEQIRLLQMKLEEEKNKKRTIRSDSKRERVERQKQNREKEDMLKKQSEELQSYIEEIDKLQHQNAQLQGDLQHYEVMIEEMKNQESILRGEKDRLSDELASCLIKNEQMNKQIQAKDKKITEILQLQKRSQQLQRQRMEQMEVKIQSIQQGAKRQMQSKTQQLHQQQLQNSLDLKEKDSLIENLKEERFNLKNELNSFKIDCQELVKEVEYIKNTKEQLQAQRQKLKETIKTNKIVFEKEKKMINNRLYELSATYKTHQRLKATIKQLYKKVRQLKQQHYKQSIQIRQALKNIGLNMQEKSRMMLDEVGKQMQVELKSLGERMQTKNEEVRIAKNEVKLRQQSIERLQKQLSGSNREISELKAELRSRRREEERLRKELKISYEQSEAKLSVLEKKYVDLLGTSSY